MTISPVLRAQATYPFVRLAQAAAEREAQGLDVIDFGNGFELDQPGISLPDPTAESKRGVALMQAFTDQTTFDSVSGNGWVVHLAKKLRWARDARVVPLQGQHGGIAPDRARSGDD